ncbi:RNA 2',3'-cyclic phosphodiesterase [Microbulbifer sp. SA54]|uniref:RNA 2',3'-cyclic phosphodiesterase n=1 Tax=Microbulbifer sp. SA54 TaxID=3401577 RepID=UPI003AAFAB8D
MQDRDTNSLRLFIGIEPDATTQRFLDATANACRQRGLPRGTRWLSHNNRHLTIAFLGETAAENVEHIESRLSTIAQETPEIYVQAVSTHPFPGPRAKLLATELLPTPELDHLHQNCRQLMLDLGMRPESNSYRPHFTLARCRLGFARFPPLPTQHYCLLNNLTLYHSLLAPGGSQYTPLAKFQLVGS